jgi:transaldolase
MKATEVLGSPRWQRVFNAGARPQRLLWASTGTKDPAASDVLYIKALAAPFTVNTMPEGTLKALLQDEGAKSFVKSWQDLMELIVSKSADLGKAS